MIDKTIFVYKPFLSLNILDFNLFFIFYLLFFYVKTETLPEKSHPYLSQQPPSEILRSEDWDPVKLLLFEYLVEGSNKKSPEYF